MKTDDKYILKLKFEKHLVLAQNVQSLLEQEHYGAAKALAVQLFDGLLEFSNEFKTKEELQMNSEEEKAAGEVAKEEVVEEAKAEATEEVAQEEATEEVKADEKAEASEEVAAEEEAPKEEA